MSTPAPEPVILAGPVQHARPSSPGRWDITPYRLRSGELGWDPAGRRAKFGDGASAWPALPDLKAYALSDELQSRVDTGLQAARARAVVRINDFGPVENGVRLEYPEGRRTFDANGNVLSVQQRPWTQAEARAAVLAAINAAVPADPLTAARRDVASTTKFAAIYGEGTYDVGTDPLFPDRNHIMFLGPTNRAYADQRNTFRLRWNGTLFARSDKDWLGVGAVGVQFLGAEVLNGTSRFIEPFPDNRKMMAAYFHGCTFDWLASFYRGPVQDVMVAYCRSRNMIDINWVVKGSDGPFIEYWVSYDHGVSWTTEFSTTGIAEPRPLLVWDISMGSIVGTYATPSAGSAGILCRNGMMESTLHGNRINGLNNVKPYASRPSGNYQTANHFNGGAPTYAADATNRGMLVLDQDDVPADGTVTVGSTTWKVWAGSYQTWRSNGTTWELWHDGRMLSGASVGARPTPASDERPSWRLSGDSYAQRWDGTRWIEQQFVISQALTGTGLWTPPGGSWRSVGSDGGDGPGLEFRDVIGPVDSSAHAVYAVNAFPGGRNGTQNACVQITDSSDVYLGHGKFDSCGDKLLHEVRRASPNQIAGVHIGAVQRGRYFAGSGTTSRMLRTRGPAAQLTNIDMATLVDGQPRVRIDEWNAADSLSVVTASGAAHTMSSAALVHDITLTANCTLTLPATANPGRRLTVLLRQDATGGRTVTWPTAVRWPAGTPPTVTAAAGARSQITLLCLGAEWVGNVTALDIR